MEVCMLESTMTRKGQVTIPKAIRDRLGVKEGEKVVTRALFLVDSESQLKAAMAGMGEAGAHKH